MYCLSRWRILSFVCDNFKRIAWYQSRQNLPRTSTNFPRHRSCPSSDLLSTFPLDHSIYIPTAIFTVAFKERPRGYPHSAGLLVPTGKKGNVDCDLQWRQSCSLQELRLAQDMPDWVKAAFRAFKATMKFVKKRIENKGFCGTVLGSRFIARVLRYFLTSKQTVKPCKTDVSVVCSFHMKNVLLWQLEEVDSWHMCSFRLMIQLLVRIDHHLETGHLPHYFNPECNLLDNVQEAELMLTRHCIKIILSDPVHAMIKSSTKSSTKGLPIRLGKAIDYWLSPKIYLASIHSAFKAALDRSGMSKLRACNAEQWCVRRCSPISNNQSDYCWSVTPWRQCYDFYDT